MVGLSPGHVTLANCCQGLAPSIRAASYSSSGIVWSPDSQMIMWKPTACQIERKMMAPRAVLGLFSQSVPDHAPKVIVSIIELINPFSWYMNFHRIDTTTIDVTTGMKKTTRKKVTPRMLRFTSTASSSAKAAWTGTTTSANTKVFQADCRNTGSVNARAKLSNPTSLGGFGEMSRAFVNERANARMTGMMRNSTRRTAAGAIMPSPAQVSRPLMERKRRRERRGVSAATVGGVTVMEITWDSGGTVGDAQRPPRARYWNPYPSLDSMLVSMSFTAVSSVLCTSAPFMMSFAAVSNVLEITA